jgi:DNA repair protein SbcD/Mre11
VKLLHTSDWHVGKQVRGNSRADEHRAVLEEIALIAEAEQVDGIIVAGDLFDTSAPSPESEEIVYRSLMRFAASGTHVIVISGNHDNARKLRVLAPMLQACGVRVISEPLRPADGGVLSFVSRDGTPLRVATLPFVSQRGIIRAEQLMSAAAFENAQEYSRRLGLIIDMLCADFNDDAVNVLVAHAFVTGGATGGGERAGHITDEYTVPSTMFPASASYVALGHLHRPQRIAAATAVHYCGSPLQLDFGESDQTKQVNIVNVEPGLPARVVPFVLRCGRAMRTYSGTTEQLRAMVNDDDDAWLRLVVREPHRAGLGDSVRAIFGERVVEVRVEAPVTTARVATTIQRQGRTPLELFNEFLAERQISDPRVPSLFTQLLEDVEHIPK